MTDTYTIPNTEWTPKQETNWENDGKPVYDRLQTEIGREMYRRTWRPKKRNDGMMQREHVKFGTAEDYVAEHVDDTLCPMGDLTSVMMRSLVTTFEEDTEKLDEAVEDIVTAKLEILEQTDPRTVERLIQKTEKVASLYGIDS